MSGGDSGFLSALLFQSYQGKAIELCGQDISVGRLREDPQTRLRKLGLTHTTSELGLAVTHPCLHLVHDENINFFTG